MFSYTLNLVVPGFVIVCCALFGLFNLFISIRLIFPRNLKYVNLKYFSFRKKFPIKVNCWFCNTNSKVPYENFNSFICPSCEQFNGFNEDGSYSKEIPEQHFSRLNSNRVAFCQRVNKRLPDVNGLCETCNRHQEMKVLQLANFKPRNESNYEEEIEEYRQKLEDSYQLCRQCTGYVNKTLNRIKMKFIGSKFSQVFKSGEKTIKDNAHENASVSTTFEKIVIFALVTLSLVNLTKELNISLDIIPNENIRNVIIHFIALKMTFFDIMKPLLGTKLNVDGLSYAAIAINSHIFMKQKIMRLMTMISLLSWSIFMLINELPSDQPYLATIRGFVAGVIALIPLIMFFKSFKKQSIVNGNGSFHKINAEILEQEDSENEVDNSHDISGERSTIVYSPSVSNFSVSPSMFNRSNLNQTRTFPPNKNLQAMSSMSRRDKSSFDLMSNRSFSIRDEVVIADRKQVQKEINKLNISDQFTSTSTVKDFNASKILNPFSLENSRCGSPSPSIASVFSGSSRTQVISPPRLESSNKGEANWIAGGYWSSPQKQLLESTLKPGSDMSRSSSQSSGLGTIDSDKNSRENSIINEEVHSIFSEPIRRGGFDRSAFLIDKPVTSRSLFGPSSISFTHPKPNSFFTSNSGSNNNSFRKYRDSSFYK